MHPVSNSALAGPGAVPPLYIRVAKEVFVIDPGVSVYIGTKAPKIDVSISQPITTSSSAVAMPSRSAIIEVSHLPDFGLIATLNEKGVWMVYSDGMKSGIEGGAAILRVLRGID